MFQSSPQQAILKVYPIKISRMLNISIFTINDETTAMRIIDLFYFLDAVKVRKLGTSACFQTSIFHIYLNNWMKGNTNNIHHTW